MNTKITAKDFFTHISIFILLYSGVVAVLNILFRAINVAYPQVSQYGYTYTSGISFPVATLVVVFPLYLFVTNFVRKEYVNMPSLKDYPLRKGMIYLTVFMAGAVLAGDLITLLYYFLDGRELTIGFILKIIAVLVVIGSVLGYYLDDLKDRLTGTRRNIWRAVALVIVLGSIIVGFSVIGSPWSQRAMRYDAQKVSDLQGIQYQVTNYYQTKQVLPQSLDQLADPIRGYNLPVDPQTGESYTYKVNSPLTFELCADFSRASIGVSGSKSITSPMYPESSKDWEHEEGVQCFTRTIDPDLYPKPIKFL